MTRTEKNREAYLKAKASGAYTASKRDSSWDPALRMHTCCESKHGAYHKASCRIRNGDISDLKLRGTAPPPPEKAKVQELKAQGLTSGQIAEELGMKLREVNKLWIG